MDKTLISVINLYPTKNISVLGYFSKYPVVEYFIENNTVLIIGESDHLWAHILSSSKDELSSLLTKHHIKTKYFFSVEDWMIPLILKIGVKDWIMTTYRYMLNERISLPPPKSDIIKLNSTYAPIIYGNSSYKDFISIEYIEDRLRRDVSAGLIVDNNLVAWGFTHDDGALGFLNVIEKYRNQGFGMEILRGLIDKRKIEKKSIFCNIMPSNIPSIKLINKLGFEKDCATSWIKLK